jgi:hypothetical protein
VYADRWLCAFALGLVMTAGWLLLKLCFAIAARAVITELQEQSDRFDMTKQSDSAALANPTHRHDKPCTPYATHGWHAGIYLRVIKAKLAPTWQSCADHCATSRVRQDALKYDGRCDFWTLRLTGDKVGVPASLGSYLPPNFYSLGYI